MKFFTYLVRNWFLDVRPQLVVLEKADLLKQYHENAVTDLVNTLNGNGRRKHFNGRAFQRTLREIKSDVLVIMK